MNFQQKDPFKKHGAGLPADTGKKNLQAGRNFLSDPPFNSCFEINYPIF
jgi:hypothetical protein